MRLSFWKPEREKPLRHGIYSRWFDDGMLAIKGLYNKGKKVGVWRFYYATGQLRAEVDYGGQLPKVAWINGNARKYTEYYASGRIKTTGEIENELKVGVWFHWFESGVLKKQIEYEPPLGGG